MTTAPRTLETLTGLMGLLLSGGAGVALKTTADFLRGRKMLGAEVRHVETDAAAIIAKASGELVTRFQDAIAGMDARHLADRERLTAKIAALERRIAVLGAAMVAAGLRPPAWHEEEEF